MRNRFIAVILLVFLAAPGRAAPLAPEARAEIDALLDRLAASSCRFNRNGTWYEAGEARAHLARKLDYFASHALLGSAEQFIEFAATKSSMTGQDYLVACPGSQPTPSAAWLGGELRALRTAHAARAAGSAAPK